MSLEGLVVDSKSISPAVELINVVKKFGEFTATDGVSLSVAKGETVALLGPSGCGKTTLLRMIAGFERPCSGELHINGRDASRKMPYERSVGLLFQQYALFPHMTAEQNIAYGLKRRGWKKQEISRRTGQMLELVQLTNLAKRWPAELSGGQQQRVALARALATEPDVVLLDEPLSALDASLRTSLRRELKQILSAVSATVLLVTHDQEEAMSFADRVLVLNKGRVEQSGSPADLYDRPANRFVAEFVGRSNWIENVTCIERTPGFDVGRAPSGALLHVSPGALLAQSDVCLRPERLVVSLVRATPPDSPNRLEGRVLEVVPVGADMQVVLETLEGIVSVVSRSHGWHAIEVGDQTAITWPIDAAICVPAGR